MVHGAAVCAGSSAGARLVTRYTRTGKQVLDGGKHMADAADEMAAMQILNALRDIEQRANAPRVTAPLRLNDCRVERQEDEMACRCGLRWSVDDPNPPLCIHRVPR